MDGRHHRAQPPRHGHDTAGPREPVQRRQLAVVPEPRERPIDLLELFPDQPPGKRRGVAPAGVRGVTRGGESDLELERGAQRTRREPDDPVRIVGFGFESGFESGYGFEPGYGYGFGFESGSVRGRGGLPGGGAPAS
ncbi:MAG TPA: hypothetical protein VIK13_08700 [Candidatus Limnocylindrales bacterium]